MRPLCLALMVTGCFSLATVLMPWHQRWAGGHGQATDMLSVMMGDSRRIFANHFFEKADVYFHSGFYPSIFDYSKAHVTPHMAADAGAMEEKNEGEEGDFMGKPRDWIDAFGRHFYPSRHTHLDQGGAHQGEKGHDDKHAGEEAKPGTEREILPWLRISAELDPTRVETYTVSSFWLRTKMGKINEAEQFLREGLRANPDSYEILFELGRLYYENRNNPDHARNLWDLAFAKWRKREAPKPVEQQDRFMLAQIFAQMGELEEKQGNLAKTLEWWQMLKKVSPHPEDIQKEIDKIQAKMAAPPVKPNPVK